MKKGSKLLSLFLSVTMALGLAVTPVMAEDVPAPAHSKTIQDNGDGTYDVTLSVTGKVDTETTTTGAGAADVVLVVDNSGSMSGNRWNELERAVDTMLTAMLPANTNHQVAVIGYGSWAQIEDFGGTYWSNSKDAIMERIYAMDDWGGTDAEEALIKTTEVLGTARSDSSKNVIFISDGYPNSARLALEQVEVLKNTYPDTTIYSVGVENSYDSFMINVAGDASRYYYASDASELSKIFEELVTVIEKAYSNVTIMDVLNDYVEVVGDVSAAVYDENGNAVEDSRTSAAAYDAVGKTVSWNLGEDKLSNNYTYTMTYTVKPTQKAVDEYAANGYPNVGEANTDAEGNATSAGKEGFFIGAATVYYTYNDMDANAPFARPVVQVEVPEAETASLLVISTAEGDENDESCTYLITEVSTGRNQEFTMPVNSQTQINGLTVGETYSVKEISCEENTKYVHDTEGQTITIQKEGNELTFAHTKVPAETPSQTPSQTPSSTPSSTPSAASPSTGDATPVAPIAMVCLLSAAAVVVLKVRNRTK